MPWLLLADDTCEEASRFWNLAAPVFGQPAAVTCCNEQQWFFVCTIVCYLLAGLLLWHSVLLKPFKLFTVFLHELSHAMAAWSCCSKVSGIEVQVRG